jgi:hypothetical protein
VARRQRDAVGVLGDGDHDAGAGGADHVGELGGGGEADVLGDVGGARLQDAEDADEHRHGAADEETDVVAGAHTLADQTGGEGVGVAVELAVGDPGAEVFGGDGVRGGGGLPLDGVMDQRIRDGDGRTEAVPVEEVLVAGGQMAQGHAGETSWLAFRVRDCLAPSWIRARL